MGVFFFTRRLHLTPGRTYILWDCGYEDILSGLDKFMDPGYNCCLITKHNPEFIANRHRNLKVVWVSEKRTENSIPPNLEHVMKTFDDFIKANPKDSIVVLEVFDYLVTSTGKRFVPAYSLLNRMLDMIVTTGNTLIVPISSKSLSKMEKALILRSSVAVINL
jgi:hypothetical protein